MVIELDSQFDKRKQVIEKIVKEYIQKNKIEISQTSIDNLVIHLSLCVARELNGTYIPTSESQIDHLKEHEYYSKAIEIIMALNKEFDIEIDKNQTSYTTMYLANINLLDIDFNCNFDLCDEDMEDVINETIVAIKEELDLDLRKNKEFYTGMTLHFYPALDRLQNNQQLTDNPLKDQIQNQHQAEFACAQILNKIVEKHYGQAFNEHELAYIALHFGTAFRQ
ncbi:MAG: PRD domain-containing protein [Coprobacillus sp.]